MFLNYSANNGKQQSSSVKKFKNYITQMWQHWCWWLGFIFLQDLESTDKLQPNNPFVYLQLH